MNAVVGRKGETMKIFRRFKVQPRFHNSFEMDFDAMSIHTLSCLRYGLSDSLVSLYSFSTFALASAVSLNSASRPSKI